MMSQSSAGPRRMLILMIAITIGTGFVVCRQLWSLAAPGQRPQTQARTIYLDDTHLIRENEEARRLRQQVDLARKRAFEHGSHACCIGPPCSWCLLHLGQCTCALGVGSGRYACRECHGGWEADQGVIPGKTKDDVRKMKTISSDFMGKPSGPAIQEPTSEEQNQSRTATTSREAEAQAIAAGEKLYNSNNCHSCHQMNGQGGNIGPDLTHEAQRHANLTWQIEHLKNPQKAHPGSTMPSYAGLMPDQLKSLASYLISRK